MIAKTTGQALRLSWTTAPAWLNLASAKARTGEGWTITWTPCLPACTSLATSAGDGNVAFPLAFVFSTDTDVSLHVDCYYGQAE